MADYGQYQQYQQQRDMLQLEVNRNKVEIDFSVFKKTQEERDILNAMRSDHKKTLIKHGFNPRIDMNINLL